MGDMLLRLHDSISAHRGEDVVFWFQWVAIMLGLEVINPKGKPSVGIASRQLWLGEEFVMVA